MGQLKVLPAQIANLIAAGEVVQRPASVVKELMENAVDADADQIGVVITDAGRTLIQVIDNGCGMSPSDAVMCFERHSTSKIASAEDLNDIVTYGFRGEALASIAAVGEITLVTRRDSDETATKVVIGDFGQVKTSSVMGARGSNFSVRNLFYNTPARRKFLKTDNVEFRHIIEDFTRVAITRPEIGFTLTHNGRDIFILKKAKSLKFRVLDLLGSNVVGDVVDISANTSIAKISGFVGRPDTARKTLGNQFFFVNGRFFRSAYFHKAVMKAYEDLIPEGVTPSYFIFIEVDPHSLDVNIHPTKTEVKFEDDSVLFQVLGACVRETLGRNSFGAGIDFNVEGAVELPQLGKSFEQYRGVSAPSPCLDPSYNPFDGEPASSHNYPQAHREAVGDCSKLFEDRPSPVGRIIIIGGKYILTPVASGVMVVNVSRARERILYEQNLRALNRTSQLTQTALFPINIQVGAAQRILIESNADQLKVLGFDIAPLGNDSIVVSGVPEGYSCEQGKVEKLVADIVDILAEGTEALPEVLNQRLAERFAALGASSGSNLSSPAEAQRLIDTLFASDNAELTSNGRRIVSIVSIGDIDKQF